MAPLDREEINAELKRLGIITPVEREVCIDEYIEYFTNCNDTFVVRIVNSIKKLLLLFFISIIQRPGWDFELNLKDIARANVQY